MDNETKSIEMTDFEIITALKNLQYDFNKLRNDWEDAKERLSEKIETLINDLKKKQNEMKYQKTINVRELAMLKSLGMKPKDLLSRVGLSTDGDTPEKNEDGSNDLPKL